MGSETIAIVVSLVAVIIAAYSIWKTSQSGTPITGKLVESTLKDATSEAVELTEVALTAARAAQQLYESGKIEKTARLDYAFKYVRKWFPNVDQERIITAIEAGVYVVNSLVMGLPKTQNP